MAQTNHQLTDYQTPHQQVAMEISKQMKRVTLKALIYATSSQSFNPLSPNSDQHQIFPCNINDYSTPEVMRIKDMITQGEFS